jgi:hypothetical protein
MSANLPLGMMAIMVLSGIIFLLIPVWLGLYRIWCEKEGKGLKELLVVWTRNWFLISSVFVLLFGGIPAVISFPANGSLESAYFMGFLALVGYGIWGVAGALGTIFICATEKIGWKDKCITCITS